MSDCKAVRSDGSPCRAHALRTSEFCFFHDPNERSALIEATRKGGSRRTVEIPEGEPLAPERVRAIISHLVEAIIAGAVDAPTVRAITYILRLDNRLHETEALEERISDLEDIMEGERPSES